MTRHNNGGLGGATGLTGRGRGRFVAGPELAEAGRAGYVFRPALIQHLGWCLVGKLLVTFSNKGGQNIRNNGVENVPAPVLKLQQSNRHDDE